MSHVRLVLLSLLCGFHGVEGRPSLNPCHSSQIKSMKGTCEVLTLPPGFCNACTLGPQYGDGPGDVQGEPNLKGQLVDCEHSMDVETDPMCLSHYESYVQLNPCDQVRAQAVQEFKSTDEATKELGRLKLDWFGYAMCEQACDCIPQEGAVRQNPVFDAYRGNCPVHAHYDICNMFPNMKLIKLNGTDYDVSNSPGICDLLRDWHDSPAGEGWWRNPQTDFDDVIKDFLERMGEATQFLEDEDHWLSCFQFELNQGRIEEVTVAPTTGAPTSPPTAPPSLPPTPTPTSPPTAPPSLPPTPTPTSTPADAVIQGLEVWNANGGKIQDLVDGGVVRLLAAGSSITIGAIASDLTAEVRFDLDSEHSYTSYKPFTLFGHALGSNYATWPEPTGSHIMTVTPYSEAGIAGESMTVDFDITTV